jgi:hypothetical protein
LQHGHDVLLIRQPALETVKPLAAPYGFGQMIATVVSPACAAAGKRVGKTREMTARFPDLRMHGYGRVEPHHIGAKVNVVAPPQALDVVLEFNAQWSIVPGRAQPAVDFAGLKNKAAPLAQRHDLVHLDH